MRSFQKKLVATAASAALVAIVGAAWAQSSDSSTAPAAAPLTSGAQDTTQAPGIDNSVRDVPADNSGAAAPSSSSTTDNGTSSTDNSSTDSTPAPRADRN